MRDNPIDVAAMNEAWSSFFLEFSPRNEEAFYKCFSYAWDEAQKHFERRITLLEQEVAWAENGYGSKGGKKP